MRVRSLHITLQIPNRISCVICSLLAYLPEFD
jgi:hypothetical protein